MKGYDLWAKLVDEGDQAVEALEPYLLSHVVNKIGGFDRFLLVLGRIYFAGALLA
jgi:hypothetical protein